MNQSGRKIKTVYKQREDKMLRAGRKLQTTHFVRYCTVIGANAPSSDRPLSESTVFADNHY